MHLHPCHFSVFPRAPRQVRRNNEGHFARWSCILYAPSVSLNQLRSLQHAACVCDFVQSGCFVVLMAGRGGPMDYIMRYAAPVCGGIFHLDHKLLLLRLIAFCTNTLLSIQRACYNVYSTARMYIPHYPSQLEALRRHGPASRYTHWLQDHLPALSAVINPTDSSLIQRRSGSAAHTNLIIGLVVGLTLAAFVIGVCIFLCCYGDSIRFSNKKHRHRRRSTSSKASKNSKASREVEHAEGAAPEGGAA